MGQQSRYGGSRKPLALTSCEVKATDMGIPRIPFKDR